MQDFPRTGKGIDERIRCVEAGYPHGGNLMVKSTPEEIAALRKKLGLIPLKPESGVGARKSYEVHKPFRGYRDLRSNIALQRDGVLPKVR